MALPLVRYPALGPSAVLHDKGGFAVNSERAARDRLWLCRPRPWRTEDVSMFAQSLSWESHSSPHFKLPCLSPVAGRAGGPGLPPRLARGPASPRTPARGHCDLQAPVLLLLLGVGFWLLPKRKLPEPRGGRNGGELLPAEPNPAFPGPFPVSSKEDVWRGLRRARTGRGPGSLSVSALSSPASGCWACVPAAAPRPSQGVCRVSAATSQRAQESELLCLGAHVFQSPTGWHCLRPFWPIHGPGHD